MDAEDVGHEIEALIAEYEAVLKSVMPATLKEAVSAWDEKIEGMLVSNFVPYALKGADKQRLIPMDRALQVLKDYEEQLVGSLVQGWTDVMFSQLFGTITVSIQAIVAAAQNFRYIWDANSVFGYIARIWKVLYKGLAIPVMVQNAVTIYRVEQRFELAMGAKKMKQNKHAKRQRRRKLTTK